MPRYSFSNLKLDIANLYGRSTWPSTITYFWASSLAFSIVGVKGSLEDVVSVVLQLNIKVVIIRKAKYLMHSFLLSKSSANKNEFFTRV